MKIRKPVIAFLLVLLLAAVYTAILFTANVYSWNKHESFRSQLQIDRIGDTIDMLQADESVITDNYSNKKQAQLRITAMLLRRFATAYSYQGPVDFYNGTVVRISGGTVIPMSDNIDFPKFEAAFIESEGLLTPITYADQNGDMKVSFFSSVRIRDNFFYVEKTAIEEIENVLKESTLFAETIQEIENTYDCKLIVINLPRSGWNDKPSFFITLDGYSLYDDPEELGITEEVLETRPDMLTIDGIQYFSTYKEIRISSLKQMIIILHDITKGAVSMLISPLLYALLTMFFMIPFILWLYWQQKYVNNFELTASQYKDWHPTQVKKKATSAIVLGTIFVFSFILIYQYVSIIRDDAKTNRNAVDIISNRFNTNGKQASSKEKIEIEWNELYARMIADILTQFEDPFLLPEIVELNEILGSQYIMIFDSEGKETLSSNGLIGYSINESEGFQIFQPLLTGFPKISTSPMKDPIFDSNVQYIGAGIPVDDGKAYGALVIAIDPDTSWKTEEERRFGQYLEKITPEGNLCLLLNKGTNTVQFSNDPELVDDFIPSIAWVENAPDNSDLDSYLINQRRYYGSYNSDDEYVFYYLTNVDYLHGNALSFAALSGLGILLTGIFMSRYMLKFYTPETYQGTARIKENQHHGEVIDIDSIEDLFDSKQGTAHLSLFQRWNCLIPEEKATLFIQILLGITLFFTLKFAQNINVRTGISVIDFIFLGNWTRGLNLLGFVASIFVIIAFILFLFTKSILLRILTGILDSKGDTIVTLIFSLLQYVGVIISIYLILGYLGFNSVVQITSISILSLAISLGSKDLVADILSGLFIIFEDDFHVGELIEVNGFKGVVDQIGVRTTRLIGLGDNIKIIDNQAVKNVLNLSRLNTWYTLEINVPLSTPINDIEEMMKKELPNIADKIPEIISGPYYKGIWSIADGKMTLAISCECLEEKIRPLRRSLNREIILIFEKYGIKLL